VPHIELKGLASEPESGGFRHRLTLKQTCDEGLKTMPLPVKFQFPDGNEVVEQILLTGRPEETFEFIFPRKAQKAVLDPEEEILCSIHQ